MGNLLTIDDFVVYLVCWASTAFLIKASIDSFINKEYFMFGLNIVIVIQMMGVILKGVDII